MSPVKKNTHSIACIADVYFGCANIFAHITTEKVKELGWVEVNLVPRVLSYPFSR